LKPIPKGFGHNAPMGREVLQPRLAPWLAYTVSAIVASMIYVGWLAISVAFETPDASLTFGFLFASFFWLANGFALTLFLMIIPWTIAVLAYRKLLWSSRIYFPGVGAIIVILLGCATASISPKPLWIEDQTFIQGAVIAAERQGICLLLAGVAFGTCYWWLAERHPTATLPSPH
jgi:hypothetical protein